MTLFISDVVDQLGISKIQGYYEQETGEYRLTIPRLILKALIYSSCARVSSSRRIASKTEEDIPFRFLAGGNMAEVRGRHMNGFKRLFVQIVHVCQEEGLVKVGQVFLGGTKVRPDASKRRAMRCGWVTHQERMLGREMDELLKEAERIDAAEDRLYDRDKRRDELPEELLHREERLDEDAPRSSRW